MDLSFEFYPSRLREILLELIAISDYDERAEILIEYAGKFKPVSKTIAEKPYPEKNKVPACESDAYVFLEKHTDGKISFHFEVTNPQGISAKALAVILAESLTHSRPEEILNISEEMVFAIFGKELSLGKGMGLKSMVLLVKTLVLCD